MALTATTLSPVRFLRRFSGNMEPPVYLFPTDETSTTFRKGDGVMIPETPDGYLAKCTGAAKLGLAGTGVPISEIDGSAFVGFVLGASAGAPPFPTSGGFAKPTNSYSGATVLVTPASLTGGIYPPESELLAICLAMPDCVFMGHLGNNADNVAGIVRATHLLKSFGLSVTASSTEPMFVDISVTTGNTIVTTLAAAYPQPYPSARSVTGVADPYKATAAATTNPAVEFAVTDSVWNRSLST